MQEDTYKKRWKGTMKENIMILLWVVTMVMNIYMTYRACADRKLLLDMEKEFTAENGKFVDEHERYDLLIEEILSTHKEIDQQLAEAVQSFKEKYDIKDEEEKDEPY